MDKFLILVCCMLSCAHAHPDLSLGYRYNQGHNSGGDLLLQAPETIATPYNPTASTYSYFASQRSVGQIDSSASLSTAQANRQVNAGGLSLQKTNLGSGLRGGLGGVRSFGDDGVKSNFNAGFLGSSHISSGSFFQAQEGVEQQNFVSPIVRKHFYIYTVPSDDDEEEMVRHIQVGQPQKNYRVVFINTPSTHSTKTKIIADIAPTEEKTAIYVLAKKNNALDIKTEVSTPAKVNNRPEVFYIKYNTPEEAAHAQHSIQAQYDALGGTSNVSNEHQIPVSSVVGTLQTSNAGNDMSTSVTSSDDTSVSNTQETYLPANPKFKYK